MSRVVEINSAEELSNYRLLWTHLLGQTRGATFFQSLDWLLAYWRHYGSEQHMRVLIVYSCHEPIGILPLVVRRERTRLGSVRVLTYPLDGWGSFYGPLGPHPTATLLAGMGHIARTPRDWELLDLRWVDRHQLDHGRTGRAMQSVGFQGQRQPWTRVSLVDCRRGWDSYWNNRPSKFRSNVRRSERRLAEQGTLRFERYRPTGIRHADADPRWDMYDVCERLAERSWQGGSASGTTLSHASVRPFLRDVHAVAASAGTLDMGLLYLDETPVAFGYQYTYQGRVYGLRMGYDPAESYAGAGHVLLKHLLEDSFRRGDELFDLGPGYLEAKRAWQTSLATTYHYSHYPLALRPQVLRLKRLVNEYVAGEEYLPGLQSA